METCKYGSGAGKRKPTAVKRKGVACRAYDYSDEAVEMCTEPLAPGELIRVVKGPLKGLEGELVEVDGKAKVVVRLDLLGCAGVDMPVGFVEKMK